MQHYQKAFIQTALSCQALKFGEFTLKSGRISPYFFNMGAFYTGGALAQIGEAYATAIQAEPWEFDIIFGPAYKGIPLAVATAMALYTQFGRHVEYCFNRKETKDHGEGGQLIGGALQGKRVLVVDDVMTKGTAMGEAMDIIQTAGGQCCGLVIALDRQEIADQAGLSAVEAVTKRYQVPVKPIITLQNIMQLTVEEPQFQQYQSSISTYQEQYGALMATT